MIIILSLTNVVVYIYTHHANIHNYVLEMIRYIHPFALVRIQLFPQNHTIFLRLVYMNASMCCTRKHICIIIY